MKFLISLLLVLSAYTDSSGMIQLRSNGDNTLSCFLCGCGEESVFNMSCKDKNYVIQMEPDGHPMKTGASDSDICPLDYGSRLQPYLLSTSRPREGRKKGEEKGEKKGEEKVLFTLAFSPFSRLSTSRGHRQL
ncbi:hypothetical protein LOTGIDRAFT_162803 [Lottia gigantea]|uniref:Uncharacterized protein n=1 Tax=Lottia gigantea TaxID=225164 RepID=V4AFJ8_LOTGI|nr:hypothetical protein LOTGIDRAFT_162803 [Lottia gigantea]ESO92151.1 hypothetical protein LOTGIDRAFT_162803 [Lottia gigantea]